MTIYDLAIFSLFVCAMMAVFSWSEMMQIRRILARIEQGKPPKT